MPSNPEKNLYRLLPGVNEVLQRPGVAQLLDQFPRELVTSAARRAVADLRERVRAGEVDEQRLVACIEELAVTLEQDVAVRRRPTLRRVLNATGVILQTNLGRAPLSEAAIEQIAEVARGYCNLEFDLDRGERNRRDVHAEALVLAVLGLEDQTHAAAVVNNCAAATFLALNTLAEGGEVVVSRGELVEIGGGFRIPEILAKSGAVLREVGTTNKTRVADYAAAIGPATRLILRVHRSNFRIEGFTEQPSLGELVELGHRTSVPVFEDQGTGCLLDLAAVGLPDESSFARSARSGAALIAASGDKLLGGPQCGLLVGERATVDRLRANPLFRALRADKLTYAALQATLLAYASGAEVPVLTMLRLTPQSVHARCVAVADAIRSEHLHAEVVGTWSVVGGGTTPGASLPSFAIALRHARMAEGALADALRRLDVPVVARVSEGRVLLDLRTVAPGDDATLSRMVQHAEFAAERGVDVAGHGA